MDVEKELETINELIRLEQPVNTVGRRKKEMYGGQDDIVDVKMQEILDSIQGKRYCIERMYEKLMEEKEELKMQSDQQNQVLTKLRLDKDAETRHLNQLKTKLNQIELELRSSQAREDGIIENIPKLKALKQMYTYITRMTLDDKARNSKLNGFIMNERKDDVNAFNFDMADPNISEQFVRNYLWDLISAGVNPVWDQLAL
jgi:hypothetical protein